MKRNDNLIAVFPGTFDPMTFGHVDLIQRGSRLFPKLIVGVGHNPEKSELFTTQERIEMITELISDLPSVTVQSYDGLTMQFVRSVHAGVLLRGIRDGSDLRDELQFANANLIVGDVETVFLMTTDQNALTSSTLIKQIVELGGADINRLSNLVPPGVLKKLQEKIGTR